MGDRDEKISLQRRGGRRVSITSSPISPSLLKRHDKSYRSPEALSPTEMLAVTDTPVDQPSIDMTFPSPFFDSASFTFKNGELENGTPTSAHLLTTEEAGKGRLMEQAENTPRTRSGNSAPEDRQPQGSRPTYLSDLNSKSSPVLGRTSESRDRGSDINVSSTRNYSTTSLSTERSASDEIPLSKMPTSKKSRLNLLNPMSLLARRRSSHNTKLEEMNINVSNLQVPAIPDNFDPSIRGSFVHDFSTPRNKRSHFDNSPRRENFASPPTVRRPSDFGTSGLQHVSSPSPALHSPLFKEHFQDDDKTLQPGQTAYLHGMASSRKVFDAPPSHTLPSFAQKLPATIPEPYKVPESEKPSVPAIPHPNAPPPPPPPPPKRTPSPYLELPTGAALPKHMTSVSSRFSFQIAGQASSAQEKLLEERHKEHFSKLPAEVTQLEDDGADAGYDDYDFDADDDFEEKIPGINIDLDEDDGISIDNEPTITNEEQRYEQQVDIAEPTLDGFHFTPTSTTFNSASPYEASEPTPRDVEGLAIGVANSKDSPHEPMFQHLRQQSGENSVPHLFLEGLRIDTGDLKKSEPPVVATTIAKTSPNISHAAFDDPDLYFDDGEFDMDEAGDDGHFDESLLDDESGHIRDIPAENAKRFEATFQRSAPDDRILLLNPQASGISRDTSSSSNFIDLGRDSSSRYPDSREDEADRGILKHTSVLTEDNLAAYHDALAEAAHFAAANGKFNRQVSFKSDPSEESEQLEVLNNQAKPEIKKSKSFDEVNAEYSDDYDTFPFDDDVLDDDLMIAEANAEALENDDDGFYGQEFGFYARAHEKDVSEFVNGGFFAARGSNGIKRSHSGKANFQEPSLTPITERSEWSTRNSVASLPLPGGIGVNAQSLPSPGISQLLDSPAWEDEISLSALIRLRRGAFGGSSTSVNSLGERSVPGNSPLVNVSNYLFPSLDASSKSKAGMGSPPHVVFSEEENDLDSEQLTLTQNTPRKKVGGTSPNTPHAQIAPSRGSDSPVTSRKVHHRRSSSGADSVSYIRDRDGHWVLERKRAGSDGEEEIVEREYLMGARI